SLAEIGNDPRGAWKGGSVEGDEAIRGFHGASLRLGDSGATEELLKFMGYEPTDIDRAIKRFALPNGNGADIIDIETIPNMPRGDLGAGSVHHIAFAVETRADQNEIRQALIDAGHNVTPVIDRDYFHAI